MFVVYWLFGVWLVGFEWDFELVLCVLWGVIVYDVWGVVGCLLGCYCCLWVGDVYLVVCEFGWDGLEDLLCVVGNGFFFCIGFVCFCF